MATRKLKSYRRRGFTLVEVLVGITVSSILIMGMGIVMVSLFRGMRESRDFADATGGVDLIRQLSFDARTGNRILFPATDGTPGDYVSGPNTGDQIMFNSLRYDPLTDTTTTVTITWESRRPIASPTDPYTVFRFTDDTPEDPANPADDLFTFGQGGLLNFDIVRNSSDSFSATMQSQQGSESVQVQLAVTLRNVIN
ncbi:MAG: type II secretion system protein [Planctomycetes bacterium]|nr:type II secretion system protein [Planctomycetota bacterium]MCB9934999.1 type II secretion system protein [Planctomycetota bacterium]